MRIANLVGGVIVALGLSSAAQAAAILPTSYYPDYNAVVFGDFTVQNSDTEGSIAAGGNVSASSYSIASKKSNGDARVVAGGNVSFNNGSVGKDGSGSVIAGGSFSGGGYGIKTILTHQSSLPIDFNEAYKTLTRASALMLKTNAIGTVSKTASGGNLLTGTHTDSNTFNISGAQFASNELTFAVPTGATILVNVSGTNVSFPGRETFPTSIDPTKIIYNFYEAADVTLKSPVRGSVLAPYANVTGSWGQVNGQLFAKSFIGTTEFHDHSFNGVVPIPAALPLMASALVGLGLVRKLRRPNDQAA